MEKQKGITLIALVITIIILLILAGVVINLSIGEHGILKQAQQAGEQYKISEILEKLELEKVDLVLRKNGELPSVQEYIDHLTNKGIISMADVIDIDDNDKNIVVEGYIFLVEKELDGNIKITYQGIPDNKPRIAKIQVIETTIDSISVKVVASNGDGGSYKYSIKNITTGETSFTLIDTNNSNEYTFADLSIDNEYIIQVELVTSEGTFIKETQNIQIEAPPPTIEVGATTHTAKQIQYTWEELNSIAKVISDNYGLEEGKVNNDTVEVNVSINGKEDTLGIGDWTTVNGYKVRILGFNHDELTSKVAYPEGETNTYAGISFEFTECIMEYLQMNNTATNLGGWKQSNARDYLNSTTYDTLENKEYIKEVDKQYIETYNDANSVTTSQDKIWLLSCSEIWNNGSSGQPYGLAVAKEGEQYKYYKSINPSSSSENSNLIKKFKKTDCVWCLRSASYDSVNNFCFISRVGKIFSDGASGSRSIAPGFAI